MSEADVQVSFGATVEHFNAGIAQVRETLQGLTSPLRGVRDNLGELAEAFVAAFAVEKIADFVKEIAELGEQAERTSEMLGLTVEQVTDLQFAAAVTGGSSEGMTRALEQLERAMSDVHNTSSVQYAAFQSLGISTDFLKEHSNDLSGVLDVIAQKFSESADGPAKTAIAMALLGRSGAEMIPLLNEGAEGMAKFKQAAQDAGVELSGPVADAMAATADSNNQLGQAWQGLGEILFQVFEPSIDATVSALTKWVEGITDGIKNATVLSSATEDLALAFDGVVAAVELVVLGFEELWTVGDEIITALTTHLTALASAVRDALTLNWGAVGSDMSADWQGQVANFQTTSDKIKQMAKDTADNIRTMFTAQMSGNAAAPNSSGGPDDRNKPALASPGQNFGGGSGTGDALAAARAKVDGEIQVLQAGLARKQQLLNSELQMHQLTEQQWIQQSEAAVDQEYEAEVALLQKELTLGGLKVQQRQEILNKLKLLEQKHADDIQKIQQKAAQDYLKTWTQVTDSIASAINSQIGSLIKGTESISQALENIGLDLLSTLAENAIKSIMNSAAMTFAGIFGNLSPIMGPAAAGPAAAGQATVAAVAGSVASFEVGTSWVPRNNFLANLHEGEGVMPAPLNSNLHGMANAWARGELGGAGGGGGQPGGHTFNINGPVFEPEKFARMVADLWDRNPSLRPIY